MILSIRHQIEYRYDRPVFLGPLTVRLRPRGDAGQALRRFELAIDPAPVVRSEVLDATGNTATVAWFEGLHSKLNLSAQSDVETLMTNPFNYLITEPSAQDLPMVYPDEERRELQPYILETCPDPTVATFAEDIVRTSGGKALDFLMTAADRIGRTCERAVRPEGEAWTAGETLRQRRGACRDLAVLLTAICRSVGLAARFVSGYHYGDDRDRHELHAWAEVYLPGAGWRGFDPGQGLATADEHVALAAAAEPAGAAAIQGVFRGTGAQSSMRYSIEMGPRA
jgi:transglutaminase-like putative cysteine protease